MLRRHRQEQIAIDQLRRFWDGLTQGNAPRATEVELEPAVVETVYAIHAQDTVPPVDPAFVDRLLGELIGQPDPAMLPHVKPVEAGGSKPHQSNGRAAPLLERVLAELEGGADPVPRSQEDKMAASLSIVRLPSPAGVPRPTGVRSIGRRPPHRALGVLATAALVLLTLASGYVAFVRGPADPGIPTAGPFAAVPAAQEASPAAPAHELLAEITVATVPLPAGEIEASLAVLTVNPGDGAAYPGHAIGVVAAVLYVRSGTMAISGEPVTVHRGPTTTPASPVAQTAGETILEAGDAVAVPLGPEHAYAVRNPGADPLVIVEAWIVAGRLPLGLQPDPAYQVGDHWNIRSASMLSDTSIVTVRLAGVVLAPGESRRPAAGGWQIAVADRPGGLVHEFHRRG